jgi:3-dehydroquinate synthetase/shikimate kinase
MNDVILTGFMGTGKSTIGKLLAARLDTEFIDTDAEIERRAGRSVSWLFAERGEAAFRRLEREVLSGLGNEGGRIIAVGGGALLEEANRQLVRGATIVCLVAEPTVLMDRISASEERPLLRGEHDVYELLERREPVYGRYPQVDTTGAAPDEVADRVAQVAGLPVSTISMPGKTPSTILLETGLLDRAGHVLRDHGVEGRVLVVTDETLDTLGWKSVVMDSLRGAGFDASVSVLPPGEDQKTLSTLEDLIEDCLDAGIERSDSIVGLGGGVVGDIAGLLAATYMRGIRLVLLPTTLLAQVDASIGGKTAVDVGSVKNVAGAFHPAEIVGIDPLALPTLPPPLVSDGVAEIVKIGMMRSVHLISSLDALGHAGDLVERPDVIWMAARLKADVVRADPTEQGIRALLNFGHTVGHGLEAAAGYRQSHGRCVAAGMAAETASTDGIAAAVSARLTSLLDCFSLPASLPGIDPTSALSAALRDKKRRNGKVRVAIPLDVGRGSVVAWDEARLRHAVSLATGMEA